MKRPMTAHPLQHTQAKMQPGQLVDQLTNTLDYTFIDLPELVGASEDGEGHTDCVRQSHSVNEDVHRNTLQQQVQQQQQQQQQWQQQVRTCQGTQQQYLAMPYWQQLQHGVHQEAPKLVLGPLGQALAAAAQSRHSGGQQPTTGADQAPQEQYQQPSVMLSAGNWPQQPAEVYSTNQQAQQQAHMFAQHQSNARSGAHDTAAQASGGSSAAMDED